MIKKIFALVILFGVLVTFFQKWLLIALLVVILLFVIRKLADLYWWGKENDKF